MDFNGKRKLETLNLANNFLYGPIAEFSGTNLCSQRKLLNPFSFDGVLNNAQCSLMRSGLCIKAGFRVDIDSCCDFEMLTTCDDSCTCRRGCKEDGSCLNFTIPNGTISSGGTPSSEVRHSNNATTLSKGIVKSMALIGQTAKTTSNDAKVIETVHAIIFNGELTTEVKGKIDKPSTITNADSTPKQSKPSLPTSSSTLAKHQTPKKNKTKVGDFIVEDDSTDGNITVQGNISAMSSSENMVVPVIMRIMLLTLLEISFRF